MSSGYMVIEMEKCHYTRAPAWSLGSFTSNPIYVSEVKRIPTIIPNLYMLK